MTMRFALICILLAQVARADGLDDLRSRWQQMLIGGASIDPTIPQVASRLTSIQSAGQRQWSSMQKASGRASLWTDIASTTISADVSSNYSRLHDMAIAWATPDQTMFQNGALLADLISGLDWMDANRYNSHSVEYDNWWDWRLERPPTWSTSPSCSTTSSRPTRSTAIWRRWSDSTPIQRS